MNDIYTDELQERVQKGIKRQKAAMRWGFLGVNVFFFFVFLFVALANLSEAETAVLILPLILWPVAIFMQFGSALADSGAIDKQIASGVVNRELGQHILEQALSQKPKREATNLDDEAMTISDDGELVPLHIHDEARQQNSQR